jgi:hypothetical protein
MKVGRTRSIRNGKTVGIQSAFDRHSRIILSQSFYRQNRNYLARFDKSSSVTGALVLYRNNNRRCLSLRATTAFSVLLMCIQRKVFYLGVSRHRSITKLLQLLNPPTITSYRYTTVYCIIIIMVIRFCSSCKGQVFSFFFMIRFFRFICVLIVLSYEIVLLLLYIVLLQC